MGSAVKTALLIRQRGRLSRGPHPSDGLESSARHLVTPPGVGSGQEGWLSLGQPGIPTAPPLLAEHFVKPEPGVLVLCPSYIWRAAAPFQGGARLTAAFDVLPA